MLIAGMVLSALALGVGGGGAGAGAPGVERRAAQTAA